MSPIALVTLTDSAPTPLADERDAWVADRHRQLSAALGSEGFEPLVPPGGEALRSPESVANLAAHLGDSAPDALVVHLPHWADPALATALVEATGLPAALFADEDPAWGGVAGMLRCTEAVRAGAGKWGRRVRSFLGDLGGLTSWLRAAEARGDLHRGCVLMWGGPRRGQEDQVTVFNRRLVGEIMSEETTALAARAEALVGSRHVKALEKWLLKSGLEVKTDKVLFQPAAWGRELALIAAARECLGEVAAQRPLLAVSVNAAEAGAEIAGHTGALLAMLPFGEGVEGPTPVIPTVDDGDVLALIGAALLGRLGWGQEAPPLFGDIAHVAEGTVTVSNPGGMALWWAAQTHAAKRALKRVTVQPECLHHGGGAWGFLGLDMDTVTVVQIGQRAGAPAVAVGLAKPRLVRAGDRHQQTWGAPWPVVKLGGGIDPTPFAERALSDHVLALPGEWTREVAHWARLEGLDPEEFGTFRPLPEDA